MTEPDCGRRLRLMRTHTAMHALCCVVEVDDRGKGFRRIRIALDE